MYDWERGFALHAIPGNRSSSLAEGESHDFSRLAVGMWGIFSRYGVEWPFKTLDCSVTSGLLSRYDGYLRNLN